jgi:hypothetical protein|tara:strand:+ start:221 stop:364 length:144 start_codon:yes stop_codon:yes gene_type:complete
VDYYEDRGERRNTMPMVGKKKYPYTKKGKAAAKKAAKKKGMKVKKGY